MICETCRGEGQKSIVYPGASTSTLIYCAPYYDEDGVLHSHDANTFTSSYSCSRGHRWSESRHGICPAKGCTFGKDQ